MAAGERVGKLGYPRVSDTSSLVRWLSATAAAIPLWASAPASGSSTEAPIEIPPGIETHADGRAPIESLYRAWLGLAERGWNVDVIAQSRPLGTRAALPIVALRSPKKGPAVWILAGIHGEEPAGPNALAVAVDDIAALGERRPVVLLPLLNPHGYARNWRYLNMAVYSGQVDGASVGDSSHLLPSPDAPARPRAARPSSPEADAITAYVQYLAKDYPPTHSIDLHEDNLIDEGYVYSQGTQGEKDPLAIAAVGVLRRNGVPIKAEGRTRFDEPVAGGIVGRVADSSIDELMSATRLVVDGEERPGPGAGTVLVLETPAAALPLSRRMAAHAALLRRLGELLEPRADSR
jgi:hypothetical protein